MAKKPAPAEPLSVKEAARRLGVAPSTLYTWRHKGIGPESYKQGSRVVLDDDKVEEYRKREREKTLRGGVG